MKNTTPDIPKPIPTAVIDAIRQIVNAHVDQIYSFTPEKARDAAVKLVLAEIGDIVREKVTPKFLAEESFGLRRPGRHKKGTEMLPNEKASNV